MHKDVVYLTPGTKKVNFPDRVQVRLSAACLARLLTQLKAWLLCLCSRILRLQTGAAMFIVSPNNLLVKITSPAYKVDWRHNSAKIRNLSYFFCNCNVQNILIV